MSWLIYATRSTMRTIFPSCVSGSTEPVCLRMPSRTSHCRLRPRRPRDAARDPRRLERVGEACPEVVAFRVDEDLRLVTEPAERLRVDDAIPVALERRAQPAFLFPLAAPPRLIGANGKGRQPLLLV